MKNFKLSPKGTRVVIFSLFYVVYSYLILAYLWRNNLLIPLNELTTSNLAQDFTTTFFAVLLIPIIIFLFIGTGLYLYIRSNKEKGSQRDAIEA